MGLIRVEPQALAAVAGLLRPYPQRLTGARHNLLGARASLPTVGDPTAAAVADELLRQLGRVVEMAAATTEGLTRALAAASGEYATADQIALRSDYGG